MSLAESPDWLFRPEDKALKMLFPTVDEPNHNSFDEFFESDFYNSGTIDVDKDSPPTDDFLTFDYSQNVSTSKQAEPPTEATPQPWRKGLWCLNAKPASDLLVAKTRKISTLAQKFIAPAHLVGNDDGVSESLIVSARSKTKTIPTTSNPVARSAKDFSRAAVREQTLSPSPGYAQLSLRDNMGQVEQWQQDFRDFHLQMPDNGTYLSSPHSRKLINHEHALQQANARVIARNATIAHAPQSPTKYHYPFNHVSRPSNDYLEENQPGIKVTEQINTFSRIKDPIEQKRQLGYVEEQYAAPAWTTESLHSSDSSSQSYNSQISSESRSHVWPHLPGQLWPTDSNGNATFSPHGRGLQLAAPMPQRIPHQILFQQDHHSDGLRLQYANSENIGRAIPYEPVHMQQVDHRMITPPLQTQPSSYPPLPPYPTESISDISPLATPRRRHTSLSRTPSPPISISPTHRSSRRSLNPRSPTKDYTPHHSRRKSIHKPGPIKDQATTTSNQDSSHRRTRSTSRPAPRTPKTPRTPTSAVNFSQIGFVNFTPKDSAKLMSDVAPSGSSKTRARREQEAKDKRKKLNEAALQAVRNAGGDVSVLESAIFV